MKELLYIPSGRFFRFLDTSHMASYSDPPTISIEQFANTEEGGSIDNGRGSIEHIVQNIINRHYLEHLYDYAEIPDNCLLSQSEFELVEVN